MCLMALMPEAIFLEISLTLSLPESVMETFKAVLPFESVDEIPWCDH